MSKQPFGYDTFTANAGFGALQPKSLFSGHDSTGTCVADAYGWKICERGVQRTQTPPTARLERPTLCAVLRGAQLRL